MPTYSYACRDCGHAFDVQQAFTDDALTICPTCGGSLRKVFSAVGVVFKGSGFYRNDSRSGGKGSSPAAATTRSAGSEGSGGSSSETSTSSSDSSGSTSSGSSGSGSSSSSSSSSTSTGSSSAGSSSGSASSTSSGGAGGSSTGSA